MYSTNETSLGMASDSLSRLCMLPWVLSVAKVFFLGKIRILTALEGKKKIPYMDSVLNSVYECTGKELLTIF